MPFIRVLENNILLTIRKNYSYDPETGILYHKRLNRIVGSKTDTGYLKINVQIKNKQTYIKVHHICWFLYYGEWPASDIDHINCSGIDNRISNLRLCSNQENHFNIKKKKKNTSQFKGVSWHIDANKWRASITKDGKQIHLGLFDNEIDAGKAYDSSAIKLFGRFAKINEYK